MHSVLKHICQYDLLLNTHSVITAAISDFIIQNNVSYGR